MSSQDQIALVTVLVLLLCFIGWESWPVGKGTPRESLIGAATSVDDSWTMEACTQTDTATLSKQEMVCEYSNIYETVIVTQTISWKVLPKEVPGE